MDPSLGPLLYCLCIIAGCALYFHYNCEDRRSKVGIETTDCAASESSKDGAQEGEETATDERPTKKPRITEWAYDILHLNKKAE
ncbi:unnamed protein product [Calypogeia fissa]